MPDSAHRNSADRARQLQGRDGSLALADRHGDCLAQIPFLAVILHLPLRGRHDSGGFTRKIDAGFGPISYLMRVESDIVDPRLISNAVKIRIAGLNDALVESNVSMHLKALIEMSVVTGASRTVEH